MNKLRLGILGTSEIAFRRFLPALKRHPKFEFAGVASRKKERTASFVQAFGGKGYDDYDALLCDDSIDAVYLPLPPALHADWAMRALQHGKHILVEKPFTTKLEDTCKLLEVARKKGLAVHENYMFVFHSQLDYIKNIANTDQLGAIRGYRMVFGFPKRASNDFRYNKALGGGALLDCGGYPVRLALELLGESVKVTQARLYQPKGYEVDLYGNAVLESDSQNVAAQISFGMDNAYQCQLEIWGSKATLIASRIFTAGDDFAPEVIISDVQGMKRFSLAPDSQFYKSIDFMHSCIMNPSDRNKSCAAILHQAQLIDAIMQQNNGKDE